MSGDPALALSFGDTGGTRCTPHLSGKVSLLMSGTVPALEPRWLPPSSAHLEPRRPGQEGREEQGLPLPGCPRARCVCSGGAVFPNVSHDF